jgi:hypothetical protein
MAHSWEGVIKMENDLKEDVPINHEVDAVVGTRMMRFIGTAISGAIIFFGLSIIIGSLSPINLRDIFGGLVSMGIGGYLFIKSIEGAGA